MDGVLTNSEVPSRKTAVRVLQELYGVTATEADFLPFMGTGEAAFLAGVAALHGATGFDAAAAKARFFELYISEYARPNSGLGFPGGAAFIAACRANGLKTALATAADRVKAEANLAAASIPASLFDAIVTADGFARLKPAPDAFLAAAAAVGVPPSRCVVIEDAAAGVRAARAAGMRVIALTTTLDRAQLESEGPNAVFGDVASLAVSDITGLGRGGGGGQGQGLDAPVGLPGPLASVSRRDALRWGSLVAGAALVTTVATRGRALAYTSPQAVVNALRDLMPRPLVMGTLSPGVGGRVGAFVRFISSLEDRGGGVPVPEFASGLDWTNTGGVPLRIGGDLRGRVLLLDFWTYCCVNCMHVLPDLAALEAKYATSPVAVIGIHSAKFDAERDTTAIAAAVRRYGVTHPVVNDAGMAAWRALGVSSWPTVAVVSPLGRVITMLPGEGHLTDLDDLLAAALIYYGQKGQLAPGPLVLPQGDGGDDAAESGPLRYPGKLALDGTGSTLFVADSTNCRVLAVDAATGAMRWAVGGRAAGLVDGSKDEALFNQPQGLAVDDARGVLYVADTENHALREIDLKTRAVRTLVGNGRRGRDYTGGGRGQSQALNSPWDVTLGPDGLVYIAMAGQHQIWVYDPAEGTASAFSGTGRERAQNGSTGGAVAWAQPSGLSLAPLAAGGAPRMYVADSESSSVRVMTLGTGAAASVAGGDPLFPDNLFRFGDHDGVGAAALMQHPLAVAADPDGLRVWVADSYNHRLKVVDTLTGAVTTVAGSGAIGRADGLSTQASFSELGGLALGPRGLLYVADTNNGLIRVVDTATGVVRTLPLKGVPRLESSPRPVPSSGGAPEGARVIRSDPIRASGGVLTATVTLPKGYHFTAGAPSAYDVSLEGPGAASVELRAVGGGGLSGDWSLLPGGELALNFSRPGGAGAALVRANVKVYFCLDGGVCLFEAASFEWPLLGGGGEGGTDEGPADVRLRFTPSPAAPAAVL